MYKLIGTLTGKSSCQHCGMGIKNIVVVKDTHTNEILHIGSTCIKKVLNITESFDERVQKELKKYNKIKAEYELYKDEESYVNKLISEGKLNEKHWEERENEYIQNTVEYLKDNAWFLHHNKERQLKQQIEVLNKLSKKGIINIEL